jgi:CubicO group peptidase (beta-lactamase class C family)
MRVGRRSVLGLGLAAGVAGAAAAASRAGPRIDLNGRPDPAFMSAVTEVADYAAQHVEAYGLPGLTLCLVGPGGTTALVRLGDAQLERAEPVGPDHLFQIGSISKSLTALAVYRLVEAGKLRLEDDAAALLPGVPLPAGGGIQLRHLLDHSSGLPDDAPVFPRGGDQRLWQGYAPGSHWSYSNLGFMLLSQIVARRAGKPFPDALAELVLRPLGMTATRPAILSRDRASYAEAYAPFYPDRPHPRAGRLAHAPWVDVTHGAGSVAATAGDMALYVRWLIRAASSGDGAPLLSKAGAARYFTATADAPGWAKDARYGAGLAHVLVDGRPMLHHTGGMIGFSSSIHVDPAAGVGCFASSNVGGIDYRPRQITAWACQRVRAATEGTPAPAPPPAPPRPEGLGDYAGTWADSMGKGFVIEVRDDHLTATMEARPYRLESVGPEAFMPAEASSNMPLVFRREGTAIVRAWWGATEYLPVRDGRAVGHFSARAPAGLQRLAGTYECDDPWRGTFHVVAQGAALTIDGVMPLTPLPDGGFRVGEEAWSPERLSFDAEIDGVPQRAVVSGVDFLRRPA